MPLRLRFAPRSSAGWLADRRASGSLRQSASIDVYRDMWEAFSAWCIGQSPALTLASLDLRDLHAFQAARFGRKSSDLSLSPRYALRLMRLIDRVLRHHAAETGVPLNTAAADWIAEHPDVRYSEAATADPLPEFLSVAEAKHLITFLSDARPRRGPRPRTAMHTLPSAGRSFATAFRLDCSWVPGSRRAT